MNCTRMRVTSRASMTVCRGRKLHTMEMRPITTTETCGKFLIGRGRVTGRDELPPRHHADDGQVNGDVNQGHANNADEDGPRNDLARVFDFVAYEANIIVTEVIVNADAGGRAQPEEKTQRKLEPL